MVYRIMCITMLVAVASGATWRGKLPLKPEHLSHKEGCYVKEIGDVIPFGESVSPVGICYRIECSQREMNYATCIDISVVDSPNCYTTDVDLSQSYPSCCPDVKCDFDNNLI
ncbi:uncharacterized protein LOC110999869 [Pieris rapae]|uniref:uncharacterized protein LOC110999869 n=1 Tax=Pieris rapae TaxID=64459 RepID=UPI000B92578A|nr:uncharacterized protein LOC110999869 [Pieris rapae]